MASEFKVGDNVEVIGKDLKGEISFIGNTDFAQGKWIGVTLPDAKGKNDGTVQGKSYFKCKPNHGIFVRQNQVALVKSPAKPKTSVTSKGTSRSGTSTPKGTATKTSAKGSSSRLSAPSAKGSSLRGSTDDVSKNSGSLSKSPSSVSNASSADGKSSPSPSTRMTYSKSGTLKKTYGRKTPASPGTERKAKTLPRGMGLNSPKGSPKLGRREPASTTSGRSSPSVGRTSSTKTLPRTSRSAPRTTSKTTPRSTLKTTPRTSRVSSPTKRTPKTTPEPTSTATDLSSVTSVSTITQDDVVFDETVDDGVFDELLSIAPSRQAPKLSALPVKDSTRQPPTSLEVPTEGSSKTGSHRRSYSGDSSGSSRSGSLKINKKTPSRGVSTDTGKKNDDVSLKKKDAEIANLQDSLKDMEEKVQFLTAKRVDDKAKIKEMEKYKVQISQFTDYKAQWTSAQGDLHEQLKTAKKEAKESGEARTRAEAELEELRDRVEEMALDKEMAEEMKECAELELERMTEKHDEIKQELDLMKEEISSGSGGGSVDNVRIKQLEMQTNQLKAAVIKLKELNTQDRKEIESLSSKLTKEESQVTELTKLKDNLEEELEEHEIMVGELTEQVECCIGAETMVEKLTETNLDLEERLKNLTDDLADLEALRDLNEELEEERMVTEAELREELEISRNTHYQLNMKVEDQSAQNNDLQNVIMQFRAYVNQLQAQLKDTQTQMTQDKEVTEGVDDEKLHQLAQMRAQLLEQSKSTTHQESYDVDFAEIDIVSNEEEVRLLKLFFPERFTQPGSDYEAIKLILLLNKLGVTSEVIGRVTSKHLKLTDLLSGASLTSLQCDKAVYAAGIVIEMAYFRVAVTTFERCIKQCDPDTFLRLGRLASDLGPHMSMLSVFRTHLEKSSLDESVTVDPVKQSAAQFLALSNTHFPDIKPSCREALSDYLMIMKHTCEGLIACANKITTSLSRVQEGSVQIEKMNGTKQHCNDFLKTMRRIKNFVPVDGKPFSFPAEIDEVLTTTMSELSDTFAALNTTAVNLSSYIAGVAEDDIITVPDIEDIIKKGCNPVGTSGTGLDRIKAHTGSLLPSLQQMAKNIQDGDYDQLGDADTKSEPPYDARAKQFKEQFSLGDQLKIQLEYKTNENFELKKMVKIKGEEVSQQAVRADMLEKRLENARRDGDGKLDTLKSELSEAKKTISDKDRQFEETMDHLQEDIEALESEKTTLKTKLEQASKRAPRAHLTESILAEQASGQPGSVKVIVEDSPATLSKLESLQNYAQLVQDENVKLMADSLKTKLAALPPLTVPTRKSPDIACERNVSELHQQLLSIIANTKVIDITKKTNGKLPADVLAEQKSSQVCLHNQYLRLKLQAQKEMGRYYGAGGFIQTPNGEFVTPEFARVLKEKESSRMFGKITIPYAKESGIRKILLDKNELARLNSTLLGT
ncbi:dynactin subunit 1-like isoform X4 [Bolinopsis microptera]|uniref:dynactin subunit 1-like isoform X4 n=1 Tax=Bolinopsis microptera TaxID=2820187 RepID=UPI00307A4AE4